MILIGSRALIFRAPQILQRAPKDFDFIGHKNEIISWLDTQNISDYTISEKYIISEANLCEFEMISPGSSSELLLNLVKEDKQTISTEFGLVPNLDLLFTLKSSHKYLKNSPHFWKTALDYHKMKAIGAKIRPEYEEFFKLREKETYNYSHPKLNVKKNDFFNGDQVIYVYDHDSIHQAMKLGENPAYESFKKDGAEVSCDKGKFFAASEEVRLRSILEETYVLALERSQIPHGDKVEPKKSFMMALSKVCSSITSGWWREYAYEHIFDAVKMYDEKYLDKFKLGIETGVVKKL